MKKLRYIFIPVLAAGAILTTVQIITNRVSFEYENDFMKMENVKGYESNGDGQLIHIQSKEEAKDLIQNTNSKFVFYVGRGECGDCSDMREFVIPQLQNKDVPLFYIDGDNYRNESGSGWANDWFEMVGSFDLEKDGYIKNYRFTYTPALNLVINGELVESFWQFGGPGKPAPGEKLSTIEATRSEYRTRYFRGGTAEQKEQGFKNAASDIDKLLSKWSKY